jgi:uncharacterized membrane protein
MKIERAPRVIAAIGGISFVGFGIWAFLEPRSFYGSLAAFPPFNKHFVHDIGAFQIGLGLALLIALVNADSLFVALAAVGLGQTMHAVAHWIDRDLGGKPSDPWLMTALAVVLVAGAVIRRKGRRHTSFRHL